ncbi:MAG: alpha/beta hydrolase [Thermoleophilaceae bacterium]|nr:alpha/beta hydrolase [Thermoleophilaceae bacterium]
MRPRAAAAVAVAALAMVAAPAANGQAPPAQQKKGPGGSQLPFRQAQSLLHESPAGDQFDYFTFEPRGYAGKPAKRPARLPVVLFLHGYGAWDPARYQPWLDHLTRAGNLVVYPRYQESRLSPPPLYTPNAIAAIRNALPWLRAHAKRPPSLRKGVIVIGHSYGGAVAANVAGRAARSGLPKPAAVFLVNPFVENAGYKPPDDAIDPDLSAIPRRAKALCLVADNDAFAGRLGCDEFWSRTRHLGAANRDYLWLHSDSHGDPDLNASHFSPSAVGTPDTHDFRGFWKLADGLRDCSLFGEHCRYALGHTREQRSLGAWSDGTRVRPLGVFDKRPPCPAAGITLGC